MPTNRHRTRRSLRPNGYGALTETRYVFMQYGFDLDGFDSAWRDADEPKECWRLNKEKILDRWNDEYPHHDPTQFYGYENYESRF